MGSRAIVSVQGLRQAYGPVVAVDGVSFEIEPGEIFGLVGPNGAGKTTTIECIEGLRPVGGGQVRVWGLDPRRERYALLPRIGVQLQSSALPEHIRVWEAIDLFASFYHRSGDAHLLEQLGLAEKRNTSFGKLSGGQKQRLFVALALVHGPELIFLDELTTGLDPHARHAIWDLLRGIREQGKTILLSSHFMEEAERLCDRVAVMDRGRIVAMGSPESLIRSLDIENRLVFTARGYQAGELGGLPGVARVEQSGERIVVHGRGAEFAGAVVNVLARQGVRFQDLRIEQPSLEDVFLALTGSQARAQQPA